MIARLAMCVHRISRAYRRATSGSACPHLRAQIQFAEIVLDGARNKENLASSPSGQPVAQYAQEHEQENISHRLAEIQRAGRGRTT